MDERRRKKKLSLAELQDCKARYRTRIEVTSLNFLSGSTEHFTV